MDDRHSEEQIYTYIITNPMRNYTMHIYAMYILLYYERDYPRDVIKTREDVCEEMTLELKAKG